MSLTNQQLKEIIEEELINLINEEEIDEKLFDTLKGLGKGLLSKVSGALSRKPKPNASQGVGRAFARYKIPQKQPEEPEIQEPEKTAQTAIVRASPTAMSTDVVDMGTSPQSPEYAKTTARVEPRKALPPGETQKQPPAEISGELPPAEKIPLLLPKPERVGIIKDFGSLMSSAEGEDYNLLNTSCITEFKKAQYYTKLNDEQKIQSLNNIDTVLKHLVVTKRIIQNPTIRPRPIAENDRPTPSMQQIGQVDFNSWYVKSLINTTKKYFGSSIPEDIIAFVIQFLFQQGRLAISQRLFNKLIHTNDPRIVTNNLQQEPQPQQESKSYKNFYNNWKRYTQTGVKI